jgi:hypothetical protein
MKYGLFLMFFFVPAFAFGCSLTEDADRMKSPEENIERYEYIFLATVSDKGQSTRDFSTVYEMLVTTDISSNVPDTITMSSPGHSCGSFFEVGMEILIFTNTLTEIDEITPQYYFQTKTERDAITKDIQRAYDTYTGPSSEPSGDFPGPLDSPLVDFVEPVTPPPAPAPTYSEESWFKTTWNKVAGFIGGLLFWRN